MAIATAFFSSVWPTTKKELDTSTIQWGLHLTTRGPSENDVVDAVGCTDEEHDANEARRHIQSGAGDCKTSNGDRLAKSGVPCSLVEAAGRPGHRD